MSSNSGSENDLPARAGITPGTQPSPSTERDKPSIEAKSGNAKPLESKPLLHLLVQYGIYVAVALFLVLVDPLRWKETTAELSQDLLYRTVIGPLYPTEQRDEITVVLFNEATLKYLGATWPVELGTHAEILMAIRDMGPRAIMVDFIFPDQRSDPSVERLRTVIREFKDSKNGQLYFARAEGVDLDWIRADLADAKLTSITSPISDGVSRTYEPCSMLNPDDPVCACVAEFNKFEACSQAIDAASPESPVALTAAFDMYRHRKGLPDIFDGFNVKSPVPMEVVWSNRLNPINNAWMRKKTDKDLEDLCLDIASDAWDWFRRVWSKSEQYSFRQTCPYTTTVAAHNLLKAPENEGLRNALRSVLKGKFVFYGADLTGLEDTVVPPTHVKLPGVYLHAMALDNLLTFEGRYKRSSLTVSGSGNAVEFFGAAVAVLLAVIVVAFGRSKPVRNAQQIPVGEAHGMAYLVILWRRSNLWIFFNLVMLMAILAVCLTLYFGPGLSPKNWLGYWALLSALSVQGGLVESIATALGKNLWPRLGEVIFTEEQT